MGSSSIPEQGSNPGPLHWECDGLATRRPGKPPSCFLMGFPVLTPSSYLTGVPGVTSPKHPQPLPLLLRTAVTLCCRQGIPNPFTGFYSFKQVTALLRHNSHTPKFTLLKVYNSVVLRMFRVQPLPQSAFPHPQIRVPLDLLIAALAPQGTKTVLQLAMPVL